MLSLLLYLYDTIFPTGIKMHIQLPGFPLVFGSTIIVSIS